MLVELSVMEQRNHAIMEAISGAPVCSAPMTTHCGMT